MDARFSVVSSKVPCCHIIYDKEIHISWSPTKSEKVGEGIVVKEGPRYLLTTLKHFCNTGFKEFLGLDIEKAPEASTSLTLFALMGFCLIVKSFFYSSTALILRTPALDACSLVILNLPNSEVFSICGPPHISVE